MIALGWSAPEAALPDWVTRHLVGPLALLAARAENGRDVLARQLALFDSEVDFLPMAPASLCPVAQAMDLAPERRSALALRLQDLRGMAQYTLHLQWDEPKSTGSWLAGRRDRLAQGKAACDWLEEAGRSWSSSSPSLRGTSALVHLLAPRALPPRIETAGAPGHSLTLIGPWPVLAFAEA